MLLLIKSKTFCIASLQGRSTQNAKHLAVRFLMHGATIEPGPDNFGSQWLFPRACANGI